MPSLNITTFKIIAVLLLFMFAGDALALWDVLEGFGIGSHVEEQTDTVLHMHESDETEHDSAPVDTCTLCPCCVSNVNMAPSTFAFVNSVGQLGFINLPIDKAITWTEYQLFHPPRSSS